MASCDVALWRSSSILEAAAWPSPLRRDWVALKPGARASRTLRVLSWNVLADCKQRAEAERGYFSGGISQAPRVLSPERSECLAWSARRWSLLHSILEHKADVLLLQEVDHWTDFWQPELAAAGYAGLWSPKDPTRSDKDGVAVLYREDRWILEDFDNGSAFAALALLREQQSGRRVLAAAAHLAPKKTPQAELLREQQSAELLERIAAFRRRVAVEESEAPLLLGGDLNAVSHSDAAIGDPLSYRQIVRSGLRSGYACAAESKEPSFTSWTLRGDRMADEVKRTVDYIFLSSALEVQGFLRLPTDDEVPPERPPTFSCPSDHFVLGLDLTFLPTSSRAPSSNSVSLAPLPEDSGLALVPSPSGPRPQRLRPRLQEALQAGEIACVAGDVSCSMEVSFVSGRARRVQATAI